MRQSTIWAHYEFSDAVKKQKKMQVTILFQDLDLLLDLQESSTRPRFAAQGSAGNCAFSCVPNSGDYLDVA